MGEPTPRAGSEPCRRAQTRPADSSEGPLRRAGQQTLASIEEKRERGEKIRCVQTVLAKGLDSVLGLRLH